MNALVVGCGSIGQRHIANLAASGRIDRVDIATSNPACLEGIPDRQKTRLVGSAGSSRADFAVVANETALHLKTAVELARRGMHLFVEKPLGAGLDGLEGLKEEVQKSGSRVFVGYNMRFLGAMGHVKETLRRGELGRLYFSKIEVGQYLPDWRRGRDYRLSYSSSRQRGGGVALDLSHEVDYMRLLFGDPSIWKVLKAKAGEIETDAEDIFEGIYSFEGGFTCSVHMDCLQRRPARTLRVEGSGGALYCDFIGKSITVRSGGRETAFTEAVLFDLDATYRDEMEHFMDMVEKGVEPAVSISDGEWALRLLNDNG